jgi:hypothetical protein
MVSSFTNLSRFAGEVFLQQRRLRLPVWQLLADLPRDVGHLGA